MNQKRLWFKAKTFGWGWVPVSWEGWAVTFAYIAFILFFFRDIDARVHSGSDMLIAFFIPFILSTSILIMICYAKGERPQWRWGKTDPKN